MADANSRDWHFWSTSPICASYEDTVARPEASFFTPPGNSSGVIPVHQFYSPSRDHNFWTVNRDELRDADFRYVGISYYVFGQPHLGTRPLQRYNALRQVGDYFHHFYTPTPEYEQLQLWKYESDLGHVYPSIASADGAPTVEVYRWALETRYPSWSCTIVHGNGAVDHRGEDIDQTPEPDAQAICQKQLEFWADVAQVDPSDYRAIIARK